MREIKFRAWHLKDQFMYHVDTLEFPVGGIRWYGPGVGLGMCHANPGYNWEENSILMQFTGLRDKNGTEIYEGDIIRMNVKYKNIFWKVVHEWYGWAFQRIDRPEWKPVSFSMAIGIRTKREIEYCKTEVIGNIYENPEMLEGE